MAKSEEQREETRRIRELRKQIIKLKRENSQLRKRNTRFENDWAISAAEQEEDFESATKVVKNNPKDADRIECPKCKSFEVFEFTLRENLYYKCQECGSKGRSNKKETGYK